MGPRSRSTLAAALPLLASLGIVTAAGLLRPGTSFAEQVRVVGLSGSPGAEGAPGDPGGPGGPGGDGQSATAVADAPAEDNRAEAVGGAGGRGGDGGSGVPLGADHGPGGAGGDGGDASAAALSDGASAVEALAIGGDGGFGGDSGRVGGEPAPRGIAGDGGDASSSAVLLTDQSSAVRGMSHAQGGDAGVTGFSAGETGGSAVATVTVTNAGTGAVDLAGVIPSLGPPVPGLGFREGAMAVAGRGRSVGGDARAEATGSGGGAVSVESIAASFAGPQDGHAQAIANASNTGPEDVSAVARAISTDGTADALAHGSSTGGGNVYVEAGIIAVSSRSRSFSLHDAVSGSTSGRLDLRQSVSAGGFFGRDPGGDAITSLVATNPGGGALGVEVEALAGWARLDQPAGNAVLGDILATSTTGADVEIDVRARGGTAGPLAPQPGTVVQENRLPGSDPTPSRIYGESNGGAVRVGASFEAGFRGLSLGPTIDGLSMEMDNVAMGATTGDLVLSQEARGGGGSGDLAGIAFGSGGSARSALAVKTASASLTLAPSATGGPGLRGGDATATANALNLGGAARVFGHATGGRAAPSDGAGGDAVVDVTARTVRDGDAVSIGEPPQIHEFIFGAVGGSGDRAFFSPVSVLADGGSASSRSTGTAKGDAVVEVFDRARGGHGGSGVNRPFAPLVDRSGDGGAAKSVAVASGGGASAVTAEALASGGMAGLNAITSGVGGDANAHATAKGRGHVESLAISEGGDSIGSFRGTGAPPGRAGSAVARASARGASGFARADASTGDGADPQLRALSEALVASRVDVAAQSTFGTALADAPRKRGLEGMAFMTGDPLAADVDRVLRKNDALAELFDRDSGAQMLALSRWRSGNPELDDGHIELVTELEIVLTETDPDRSLVLAAFGVSFDEDDDEDEHEFVELTFGIERNGVAVGEEMTFHSFETAAAFFEDALFDLGLGVSEGDQILASFGLTAGEESVFGMGMAFAVVTPEPGSGLLLGFGLVVVALQRRRTH